MAEVPGADFLRAVEGFERRMARLAGLVNAAHGELVDLVAEALDEGFAAGWGIHSPAHWLAWQAGLAPARAAGVVRLAERRAELPTVMEALRAGELALDAAIEIARLAPAEYEASVTELARVATVSQLRRVLRSYGYGPSPEDDKPKPITEERTVSTGTDERGWWMRGRLPADEGAVVEKALEAARDDLFRTLRDDQRAAEARLGLPEAPAPKVSMADGLLAVAESSLAAGAAAHPGSDRYHVHLHLDATPTDADPGGTLSIAMGPPLPAALRRLLLCSCDQRPVFEVHGIALSVGRKTRTISDRLRRIVKHRDGGCRVPGCGRTWSIEVHHIWHWEDGGPTDTDNLLALCRAHHRQHHLGHLGISGNADLPPGSEGAVVVTDPFGRPLAGAGTPTALRPDQTVPAVAADLGIAPEPDAYVHPDGNRLDGHWVTLAPNRPDPPEEPTSPRRQPVARSEPGDAGDDGDGPRRSAA